MVSFDIKPLFTSILLTEALNLRPQNLDKYQTHIWNFIKISFFNLLKITVFESFDGNFYQQCDGVATFVHFVSS